MKHELGDQWIENGRMYKAVRQIGTQLEKKDLGPVNEFGCLPNPWNKNKYPTIYSTGDGVNFEVQWIVESDNGTTHVRAYGNTRQEAKDAWNRRA